MCILIEHSRMYCQWDGQDRSQKCSEQAQRLNRKIQYTGFLSSIRSISLDSRVKTYNKTYIGLTTGRGAVRPGRYVHTRLHDCRTGACIPANFNRFCSLQKFVLPYTVLYVHHTYCVPFACFLSQRDSVRRRIWRGHEELQNIDY